MDTPCWPAPAVSLCPIATKAANDKPGKVAIKHPVSLCSSGRKSCFKNFYAPRKRFRPATGHVDACLRLAHHYYSSFKASSHGEGIKCLASAKEFFAKAADKGSCEGSLWLPGAAAMRSRLGSKSFSIRQSSFVYGATRSVTPALSRVSNA